MIAIGVLLLIASVIAFFFGTIAYGDIGLSMIFVSVVALLAGIGFLVGNSKIKRMK